jgi:hypothetical protein
VPSLAVHHSVMKERTHLQTQWKKSGALDMSLKDWVVLSADDTTAKVRLLATQLGLYYIIIYCKRNQTARANSIPPRSIPDSQVKREGWGGLSTSESGRCSLTLVTAGRTPHFALNRA